MENFIVVSILDTVANNLFFSPYSLITVIASLKTFCHILLHGMTLCHNAVTFCLNVVTLCHILLSDMKLCHVTYDIM